MLDIYNIPDQELNRQVFYSQGAGNAWQTWIKPRGVKFVYLTLIGGGAGGNAGGSGIAGSQRLGGGGGGSSAINTCICNANMVPDLLYIQVASGGTGGIAATLLTGGTTGGTSYVSVYPSITPYSVLLSSCNAAASGGTTLGAGGAAATIFSNTQSIWCFATNFNAVVGTAGGAGGTGNAVGTSIIPALTVTGGAGGAGSATLNEAGGNITASGYFPAITGGATGGGNGPNGTSVLPSFNDSSSRIMFFLGGTGGGSTNNGIGGNGGNGGYGCGGGGGGAGTTGGNGGNGGDGLIIITSW